MTANSLQAVLDSHPDIVGFLRNQQTGPNVYPGVPAEFTNWRDEQWAWQHTAVLYNQSYHMVDLLVEGPDAFKMLNYLGVNSFNNFTVDKAKQWVPCTPEGYVIGDVGPFGGAAEALDLRPDGGRVGIAGEQCPEPSDAGHHLGHDAVGTHSGPARPLASSRVGPNA